MNEIISPWALYWVLQLDSVKELFIIASVILSFVGVLVASFGWVEDEEKATLIGTRILKVCLVLIPLAVFTPNTKNMAAILIIPTVVNSQEAQALGKKSLGVAGLALERLTELLEAKEE